MTLCKAFIAWMMATFGGPDADCGPALTASVSVSSASVRMQQSTCEGRFGGNSLKDGRPGQGHGSPSRGNIWGANGFWHGIFNGI